MYIGNGKGDTLENQLRVLPKLKHTELCNSHLTASIDQKEQRQFIGFLENL